MSEQLRFTIWACPQCGYWRGDKSSGVHQFFPAEGGSQRHELVAVEVIEAAPVDAEIRGLARGLTATRRDLSDALRENAELEQFVRLCATGERPDGTYNLGREALEQRARELLEEMGGQP